MNLYILDIAFTYQDRIEHLYPVILQNDQEVILIDGGYAGFMPLLDNALRQQGLSLDNLTGIIITHHDIDHMGCAYELKETYPLLKIYTSVWDAAYVEGREKSLRLQQAEAIYDTLPEEHKAWARSFQETLKAVKPVNVDDVLSDGQEIPFMPGVEVVHTPGHMPGHISLYLKESKTLIAADALVCEDGKLEIANPSFTLDMPAAVASIRKLQQLDIDKIVCYHGGVVDTAIPAKINQLLNAYGS
jgi:glyoxylase-like metal-dependent hydrolase (beta-lactamase superfamily II)